MSQHITDAEILDLVDIPLMVEACREAFEMVGRGEILNPARSQRVEVRDGLDFFGLDMPAEWPGHYRSRKIIEEYSDVAAGQLARRVAYVQFEDLQSGVSLRLDAGVITDMRTGAAAAVGLSFLAGRAVERVAVLGTGRVARQVVLACDHLFQLTELRSTSRRATNRDAFVTQVGPSLKTQLTMTTSIEACVEGVDAVLMAVPTPEPIIDVDHLKGVDTVVVIAGDSRTRQVTQQVLCDCPVIVDQYEQALTSGEFRWAAEQDRLHEINLMRSPIGDVLSVADAACGRVPVSGGVVYLTGMAAQDLCAAVRVHERWTQHREIGPAH